MKTLNTLYLTEGKQQALQVKGANKELVDVVSQALDPTPTNKFTYILTKLHLTTDFDAYNFDAKFARQLISRAIEKGFKKDIDNYTSWEDLQKDLEAEAYRVTRGDKRKGIRGLKEGKDYILLHEEDTWNAYIPLNHDASQVLGSDRVGKGEAEWCISANKSSYWDDYRQEGNYFIIFVNYSDSPRSQWVKFAVQLSLENDPFKGIWDEKDHLHDDPDYLLERVSNIDLSLFSALIEDAKSYVDKYFIYELPSWIADAYTTGMVAKTLNPSLNLVFWSSGIWNSGTWVGGTWESGTWKFGIWEDGTWEDGTWKKGLWKFGIWEFGTWVEGTWKDGTWVEGTWKDGTWENGTWENGTWESGYWEKGLWYDGFWKDGRWENGTWENGTWEDGLWKDGTWKDGEWEKGTWLNGTWEKGDWKKGKIYSSKFNDGVDSRVDPKEFYRIEKQTKTIEELAKAVERKK